MPGPRPVILGPRAGNLSHSIDDYPDGIILPVDKPYRWTSADVIRKLKFAAIKHFGKKNLKVGHAGTLDPLATGVLLVCIGNACKQAQQLQDTDKEYIAGIRFGATTPSYDLEKNVDRTFPYDHITEDAVRSVLPSFLGEQEQIAPLFSAKSVDGVRAYELARKLYRAGDYSAIDSAALETLHRSRITISELELLEFIPSAEEDRDSLSENSVPLRSTPAPPIASCVPAARELVFNGPLPLPVCGGAHVSERESLPSSASCRINVSDTLAMGLPEAVIRIACSKGTYIRAFARDLGEALGSGAHLGSLVRSRSGRFVVSEALSITDALSLLAQ